MTKNELSRSDITYIHKLVAFLEQHARILREELDNFRLLFKENLDHLIAYLEDIYEKLANITQTIAQLKKKVLEGETD